MTKIEIIVDSMKEFKEYEQLIFNSKPLQEDVEISLLCKDTYDAGFYETRKEFGELRFVTT